MCERLTTAAAAGHSIRLQVGKEIYFVGLIDVLCEYGLKKQLEHHYKAARHGEKYSSGKEASFQNFSAVDPSQYSRRFRKFVDDALV